MRYMVMHKTNAYWEGGPKPDPEVIQRVGGMVGEMQRAGVLLGGDGLGPSSAGARVRLSGGAATVTPGPFGGGNPLPARYAMFRAGSIEEAAGIGARFGRIFGDVTVDVRHANEVWDLGLAPKPEGLTTRRYMAVVNADAASESGRPLSAEQQSALKAFTKELEGKGVFLGLEHFEPSSKAKRLRLPDGVSARTNAATGAKAKHVVMDGPFTETKELLGGFVIVEAPTLEEAVKWGLTYVAAVETEEVDVRGLVG